MRYGRGPPVNYFFTPFSRDARRRYRTAVHSRNARPDDNLKKLAPGGASLVNDHRGRFGVRWDGSPSTMIAPRQNNGAEILQLYRIRMKTSGKRRVLRTGIYECGCGWEGGGCDCSRRERRRDGAHAKRAEADFTGRAR